MSRRILVVDDEPTLRVLIGRAFRERGYEVVEATDGLSALDLVRSASQPFNLVVTNSRMPHLDGPRLAECLREIDPSLPIVHVSGSHTLRQEMPDGIPTIFKPFNLWDLVQAAELLMPKDGSR